MNGFVQIRGVHTGADPGFWERGGGGGGGGPINIFTTGGGPVTARASRGALIAPSVGSGASPQPLFCFCVNLA